MKIKNLLTLFIFCLMVLLSCAKNETEEAQPELKEPELLSSSPENGATNINILTEQAELLFNSDITIANKSRITVNGLIVEEAVAEGEKLTISLPSLEAKTLYTISIGELAIKRNGGAVNSESMTITFTTDKAPDISITDSLVVSNPSQEVRNLYGFIKENYGENVISSAMANVNWNINEAEWVNLHTGKYPAIATFDYVHLYASPANWIDYTDISVVEDWWANNGIISAGWHWVVPTYEGSTDYTYKPSETTFRPENALTEGTWENEIVNADLEKICENLLLLKNKNIPIIWRPLHEAAGNIYEYPDGKAWFWWGYDGAEAYKDLWIYMFNYFENKGLNNLIWVWTTQTKDNAFYPGDAYVDMIGRDIYNTTDVSAIIDQYNSIQETYPTKIITLSECGNVSPISSQWTEGAKWSYFMPWYDYERTNDITDENFNGTDHQYANAEWWIDAMNHEAVITLDEMPNLH